MHRTTCLLQYLVWGALLALLVCGPYTCPAQDGPRPSAVIVPIGGTVRLQMKSKKAIKSVVNPKENVITIRTVAGDPSTILITGQQPDVTTLELTDVDDRKETYEVIVQLDVEYLRTQLRRAVPTANITPIPSSNNAVILTGTVALADDVDTILKVAQSIGGIQVINAMKVGGVQQVQLDVVVVSVARTLNRNIGFDFEVNSRNSFFGSFVSQTAGMPSAVGAGAAQGGLGATAPGAGILGAGLLGTPSGSANALFGVLHSGWGLLGFLQALKEEGVAKFIASPTLVTLSGRPASFIVGGDQAVPVVGGIGGATGIQFEPFGTQLQFLPIVEGNGKIYMEVNPSITDLDASFGAIVLGSVIPGRRRSTVNTTVMMETGQTLVIGGLTRHNTSANARRVPLLGELPFIGNLFSNRATTDEDEELLILVTPHLVDPQDCNQVTKVLPGQETRSPDDFELYLEGILEAPRGPRQVFQHKRYVPAYKNSPSVEVFPCPGAHAYGSAGVDGNAVPALPPPGGLAAETQLAPPIPPAAPALSMPPVPPGIPTPEPMPAQLPKGSD